jgi:hypothetical protein
VILDADVDARPPRLALGRHHQHRRRLPAAHVAALRLRRLQRSHHALGQISALIAVGRRHRPRHSLRPHHVGLTGEPLAEDVAGIRDAVLAGVRRGATAGVDDTELAVARQLIAGQHRGDRGLGVEPLLQPIERVRAVRDLGHRLRRDRADGRPAPRHDATDGEPMRLHRDPQLPAGRVARDDRVRPAAHRPIIAGASSRLS